MKKFANPKREKGSELLGKPVSPVKPRILSVEDTEMEVSSHQLSAPTCVVPVVQGKLASPVQPREKKVSDSTGPGWKSCS